MGARSWFLVPALQRSRHFRNAGARELKFYTGTQERGTQKYSIGKLNLRSCAEMTGAPPSPYTRETGLSVSSGQVWPGRFNPLPPPHPIEAPPSGGIQN